MRNIENGYYKYIPTKEFEVSQNRRVYKAYFLDEFIGYRVKTTAKKLVKGMEKSSGFQFKPCKKIYKDVDDNLRFILC